MTATPDRLSVKTLLDEVRTWIDDDPDPRTRDELTEILRRAELGDEAMREPALAELRERFSGPLAFGTAGLRGRMGGGQTRMNRAVVIRAAAGLASYLREQLPSEQPRVVIGYDAREDSDVFAHDSASVFTGGGCHAILMPSALPTPVLAFAVRALDADAGVMVTASHNPPWDNGYKVYLGGRVVQDEGCGAQIVPPMDGEIAQKIASIGPARAVSQPLHGWTTLNAGILDAYLSEAMTVLTQDGARGVSIVLTPLHGVGGAPVVEALARGGFTQVHVVAEQAEPDPAFPTVSFPNPEEPGALDLALEQARFRAADLVIANDPDADRCAVAVPDPGRLTERYEPQWRALTGDELGWLLAEHVLRIRAGALTGDSAVACSIVSSRMLAGIAAEHGVRHVETLTGFKWISRVPGLVFGYEEALGYCIDPESVRDKDGLTAALAVAELAAGLKAQGRSLLDALDELAVKHGVHDTAQVSIRVEDVAEIPPMLQRISTKPPSSLGDSAVVAVDDLSEPDPASGVPPTTGVRLLAEDGTRVVVRPSGTEPKLKCYLESIVKVGAPHRASGEEADDGVTGSALQAARREARGRIDGTRSDLLRALRA